MIDKKHLIYHFLSLISSGKVITYGQISRFLKINSARAVGQILHQNNNPKIPCFKVVFTDGSLSENYGFGGIKKQRESLEKEGVIFNQDGKVDLKKSLWQPKKSIKALYNF
jgi:methylated-DNA-protein-cysteine methyltransferase-like protein